MADDEISQTYGTQEQIEFARRMAEVLLRQRGQQMSPGMAILPGSWMYSIPDAIKYLGGAQYRDIAGIQGRNLSDRKVDPEAKPFRGKRFGKWATPSAEHGSSYAKSAAAVDPSSVPSPVPVRSVKTSSIEPFSPPITPPPLETQGLEGEAPIPGLFDGMSTTVKPAVPDFETEVNPEVPFTPGRSKGITTGSVPPPLGPGPDAPDSDISYPTQSNLEAELDKIVNSPAHKNKSPEAKERARNALRRLTEEARGHFGRDVTVSEAIWYAQNKGTLAPNELGADPRMNLGGPETSPGAAPMGAGGPSPGVSVGGPASETYDVAQRYESQPGTVHPGAKAPFGPNPSGYTGPPPDIPYVETIDEMKQILRGTPVDQHQRVLEDWRKRQQEYEAFKAPGGAIRATPRPGGGGNYKFTPGDATVPLTKDTIQQKPQLGPDGEMIYKPMVPGPTSDRKGDKGGPFGGAEPIMKDLGRIGGEIRATDALREQGVAAIGKAKERSTEALRTRQMIQEMQVANETPWGPRGPTGPTMLKVRQFIDNFWPGQGTPQSTKDAELLSKLNTLIASRIVNTFTDRGSNFELDSFMRANAGLLTTQAGSKMLLDIMHQEANQTIKIGRMAAKETGESAHDFSKREQEFYENNPLTVLHGDKRIHLLPLSTATPDEQIAMINKLKSGDWFWDINRNQAVRKK